MRIIAPGGRHGWRTPPSPLSLLPTPYPLPWWLPPQPLRPQCPLLTPSLPPPRQATQLPRGRLGRGSCMLLGAPRSRRGALMAIHLCRRSRCLNLCQSPGAGPAMARGTWALLPPARCCWTRPRCPPRTPWRPGEARQVGCALPNPFGGLLLLLFLLLLLLQPLLPWARRGRPCPPPRPRMGGWW